MPGDTGNKRVLRILLECILVSTKVEPYIIANCVKKIKRRLPNVHAILVQSLHSKMKSNTFRDFLTNETAESGTIFNSYGSKFLRAFKNFITSILEDWSFQEKKNNHGMKNGNIVL